MNKIFIRKEVYGMLVFSPTENCFYQIMNDELKQAIEDFVLTNNINEKFKEDFNKLNFGKYPIKVVDNTRFGNEKFIAIETYFDYTAKCNQNCEYCYNKKFLKDKTISQENVRKILKDFYDLGIARVHLAGGEPTIDYEGLKNYVEYTNELGLKLSMATNGTILTDRICELLTSNNLISVSISLDSADETVNDSYRGKGNFKRVLDGLERLKKYKQKNNSDVKICFKPVYYPNITDNEIKDLIEFAIEKEVDIIKFANPERSDAHNLNYFSEIKESYYDCLKRIANISKNYKDKICITQVTNPANYDLDIGVDINHGCIGAQELITINPDGRITPCLMNHTYLGNYFDYKNLEEFYMTSQELDSYRKLISNESCKGCRLQRSCRGGCQVRKIANYGKIQDVDPLCPINVVERNVEISAKNIKKINVYHSL